MLLSRIHLQAYLQNHTISGKVTWPNSGPFHGFPFLPNHQSQCHLGQLTVQGLFCTDLLLLLYLSVTSVYIPIPGIVQLIKIGEHLKSSYEKIWPNINTLKYQDLIVYSTRYRRTFQSLIAFLFGLIPHETLSKINVQESQSMSFCFKDCGCSAAEKVNKQVHYKKCSQLNFLTLLL